MKSPQSKADEMWPAAVEESPGRAEQTQDRKQRKRDADRLAQREHRRRQKQHIQDLEAEIALLKLQPSHERTVQLVEENKLLKEEVCLMPTRCAGVPVTLLLSLARVSSARSWKCTLACQHITFEPIPHLYPRHIHTQQCLQ
ncbi:hypothetical protein EDB81DRAFT_347786 [Dactylonectria macrodidyma]|uniref:BZIP domain-containing protein n=1 Tax=Dactylonectria macrodidyma TaxID=307937 RepID=A0A9P9FHC0_9HYPO|nr:hypothetical protein EDB81DRAFT_347786 [Dactylonectria macrodidyma]